jgi:hypothetical protein
MTSLLTLLVACEPDTVTVTGEGVRIVIADIEDLVLAKVFAVALDRSEALTLRCEMSDDASEVHILNEPAATEHSLRLFGLLADSTYDCTVETETAHAEFQVSTDPLPTWLPEWTVTGETTGYTLFNHLLNGLDANDQKLLIVDPQGQVRWYHLISEDVAGDLDSRYLGDGRVLYGGGYGGRPRSIDLAGETLYRLDSPLTGRTHHHHTEALDDGSVLSLVTTTNLVPENKEDWTGFGIEVVDPISGDLVWSWDSQTAVDAGQLPVPGSDKDPYHANAVWWTTDADGPAIYVSLRDRDAWMRLDRDTGLFTWTLGVDGDFTLLDESGEPSGPESWFYLQHAPELTGETLVVYDNGFGRPGGSYSRVVMYTLDIAERTIQQTWDWTEDHWTEPVWGDADLLSNGHVLVARGHCWDCNSADPDGRSALIELDPTLDEPTWRLDFTSDRDGLYRAQRIDGCALFDNQRWCP